MGRFSFCVSGKIGVALFSMVSIGYDVVFGCSRVFICIRDCYYRNFMNLFAFLISFN